MKTPQCRADELDAALDAMDGNGPLHPKMLFDEWGNRVNEDGSLWNLDGKLAARNGND